MRAGRNSRRHCACSSVGVQPTPHLLDHPARSRLPSCPPDPVPQPVLRLRPQQLWRVAAVDALSGGRLDAVLSLLSWLPSFAGTA